ncbi:MULTISPECIES: hypothetical protein [Micromonospora]|uniref:Uncharacterized protein n=1 Tax=Micromonospora peucetia TaxID=47871 RepID=A0A1C6V3M0_9ACTN|nr:MULTISPECIES: hypothetical protein [Micromonospora]MDW3850602.1 hypothetical protein [Micromonospora sp. BRA006-A]SCL60989.1 hypothetical protein GA0070608_2399 [Micromonospora peucetia]
MNSFPDPAPPDEPTPARLMELYPPGKSPVIDRAENALRAFEATDRPSAERLLSQWHHSPELSRRERAAVLARFDPTGSSGRGWT